MDSIPLKRCTKCRQEFPETPEYFHRDKKGKNGLSARCKVCAKKATRTWYRNNTERALLTIKEWQDANPEKVREIKQRSADKNREKTNAKHRDKWHNDPEFRQIHYQRGLDWKHRNPGYKREDFKVRANTAVSNAVRLGKFPPAKDFLCAECGNPAQHYHHESYEPEHWFDVIPLCTKCHGKTWRKSG